MESQEDETVERRDKYFATGMVAVLIVLGIASFITSDDDEDAPKEKAVATDSYRELPPVQPMHEADRPSTRILNRQQQAVFESRKAACLAAINNAEEQLKRAISLDQEHWEKLTDLESNSLGQKIASNEDLIEMYLMLKDAPQLGDQSELALQLDELRRTTEFIRSSAELPSIANVKKQMTNIENGINDKLAAAKLGQRQFKALEYLAEKESPHSLNLSEVAEAIATARTAEHQIRLAKARREAKRQNLESEEERVRDLTQQVAEAENAIQQSRNRVKIATAKAKAELARREAEKRQLKLEMQNDMAEIKSLLKPLISPGYTQHLYKNAYKNDESTEARPVSFGALVGFGYLTDSQEKLEAFWRSTNGFNDRPLGSFPKPRNSVQGFDEARPLVLRAQELLKKYGELMVEEGLLSP